MSEPFWRRRGGLRLVLLFAALVALFVVARQTGLVDAASVERLRTIVADTGAWGGLVFIALFAGGQFAHVPGMVFVVVGLLVFGQFVGFALAWVGAVIAVSVSFYFVRLVGGTPLTDASTPWLARSLAQLEARPVRTVILLRLVLWLNPLLNTTLALTRLRYRDYLIGSAIGLLAPIAFVAVVLDWAVRVL